MNRDEDGDSSGHTPVRRSFAKPGEIADSPTDGNAITVVEITDPDGEPTGLLIEWESHNDSQWIWAEAGSYEHILP